MTRPAAVPGRISQTVGALSIVLGSLVFVWATPFPVFGLCSGAQFAPAEVQSHAPTPGVVIGVLMGAPKVIRTLPAAGG